jgi:predicted GTPase
VVVSKTDAASHAQVEQAETAARALAPHATIVRGASPVALEDPEAVRGRRVLVIDDGPTLTHGGMPYGAGYVAAVAAGAAEIVDPRPYAAPAIREALEQYPHLRSVLPALGYGAEQLAALRQTIAATPADVVVSGTPIDLAALVEIPMRVIRARYEFAETGEPGLGTVVDEACERLLAGTGGVR